MFYVLQTPYICLYTWTVECRFWVIRPWPQPSGDPAPHISRHFWSALPPPPSNAVKYRLTLDSIVRGELKCRLFIKILKINKYITQTTYYEHFLSHFVHKLKQGYVLSGCCFLNSILQPLIQVFWLIPSHRSEAFLCGPLLIVTEDRKTNQLLNWPGTDSYREQ